jgi:glucosamine-6-phosphate deaminase
MSFYARYIERRRVERKKGLRMMEHLKYGELEVSILPTNEALGLTAAQDFADAVAAELATRDEMAVILATGNSQLSFIHAVVVREDIDWSRISVLHMDEYIGMHEDHPASFRRWMRERLVERVPLKAFYGVQGDHVPVEEEVARYSSLVRELDPSVCVMGIGENGHLAFNDPPADFDTEELAHVVQLAETARTQQVGEGHFASLEETPTRAISLTVHALLRPRHVMVLTPEARKAVAVKAALEGPVTPQCPASILQTQPQAHLYLDAESSALLGGRR